MFVLFCDPFKTLASIKAFSLDGTSKLSTTPKIRYLAIAGSDADGIKIFELTCFSGI
jgi:DNA polymerase II small subunit/DNA polymerase delta subunit B